MRPLITYCRDASCSGFSSWLTPHPIGERGALEFDTFSGVDLGLAIQRKVVGILGNENMRQQTWLR